MGLIRTKYSQGIITVPYPSLAGAVTAMRFAHALAAAPAQGDIIELAQLPAGMRVIDMILDTDDLDSGTAILLDVGIMSGNWGDNDNARTCGAEFISGSNVAQAGGAVRPTLKTAFRTAPAVNDRSIGVKINTAAGTFVAGTIGLTLLFGSD